MANSLKHSSVGTSLSQTEWEAIDAHVVESQATGDILYAESSSSLQRLGIGSTGDYLRVASGKPDWQATTSITSLGTIATGVWQGTDVGVAYGGTGVSTLTDNAVLTGTGASAITAESNLTFTGSLLTVTGAVTVGVDDTGHDVKFFGATASTYMLWDESADGLYLVKSKLNVSADTFSYINNNAYGTGVFPLLYLRQGRGTEASPSATQDNDVIGQLGFQAYGASAFRNSCYIYGRAAENATDSTSAADLEFWTTPTGSVSPVLRLTIDTTGDVDIHSGDLLNVGAAGNDWTTNALTLAGGSSSQKIKTETTGSGVNADFEAKIPASATGNASLIFTQGSGDGSANNQQFRFAYQASVGYFRFRNEHLGADVWRYSDGDATMDCNSTWDDNAFDDEDDAMVLYRAFGLEHKQPVYEQGKQILRSNSEELISLGILRRYDDGWVGYNDQRMAPLFAGGIYQNRFRMDTQFAELDARLKKLETRS